MNQENEIESLCGKFSHLISAFGVSSKMKIRPGYNYAALIGGVLFSIFPLFMNRNDLLSNISFPQLESEEYYTSLQICMSMCVPLLLDVVMDYSAAHAFFGLQFHRMLMILSLMAPCAVIYWFCFDPIRRALSLSMVLAQQLLLCASMLLLVNHYDNKFWTDVRTTTLIVLHAVANGAIGLRYSVDASFVYVAIVAGLAHVSMFTVLSVMWFAQACQLVVVFPAAPQQGHRQQQLQSRMQMQQQQRMHQEEGGVGEHSHEYQPSIGSIWSSVAEVAAGVCDCSVAPRLLLPQLNFQRLTQDQWTCSLYLLCLFWKLMYLLSASSRPLDQYHVGIVWTQTIFLVLLIVVPGRLTKRRAELSDVALERKKVFVQYISHEARGPLQVAAMGLELHLDDLREALSGGDVDEQGDGERSASTSELFASPAYRQQWINQRCKHVNEIADACTSAQNTLNDMLTYDKIESGMLQVDRAVVSVLPFLQRENSAFAIQARYKNIDMVLDWKEQPESLHSSFQHTSLHVDRHKMSQVIRNLLSNALKFTPEYGKITTKVRILRVVDGHGADSEAATLPQHNQHGPNNCTNNSSSSPSHSTSGQPSQAPSLSASQDEAALSHHGGGLNDFCLPHKGSPSTTHRHSMTTLSSTSQSHTQYTTGIGAESSSSIARYESGKSSSTIVMEGHQAADEESSFSSRRFKPQTQVQVQHQRRKSSKSMGSLIGSILQNSLTSITTTTAATSTDMERKNSSSFEARPEGRYTPYDGREGEGEGCVIDISELPYVARQSDDKREQDRELQLQEDLVCRIEVHDTGVGIDAANLNKLFGRYVQFNPGELQQGGGSGLGLWLSKKIVELHGGCIGATSQVGHGCVFYVELPVYSIAPVPVPFTAAELQAASAASSSSSVGDGVSAHESLGLVTPFNAADISGEGKNPTSTSSAGLIAGPGGHRNSHFRKPKVHPGSAAPSVDGDVERDRDFSEQHSFSFSRDENCGNAYLKIGSYNSNSANRPRVDSGNRPRANSNGSRQPDSDSRTRSRCDSGPRPADGDGLASIYDSDDCASEGTHGGGCQEQQLGGGGGVSNTKHRLLLQNQELLQRNLNAVLVHTMFTGEQADEDHGGKGNAAKPTGGRHSGILLAKGASANNSNAGSRTNSVVAVGDSGHVHGHSRNQGRAPAQGEVQGWAGSVAASGSAIRSVASSRRQSDASSRRQSDASVVGEAAFVSSPKVISHGSSPPRAVNQSSSLRRSSDEIISQTSNSVSIIASSLETSASSSRGGGLTIDALNDAIWVRLNVLVVDDVPSNRKVLCRALNQMNGARVLPVSGSATAASSTAAVSYGGTNTTQALRYAITTFEAPDGQDAYEMVARSMGVNFISELGPSRGNRARATSSPNTTAASISNSPAAARGRHANANFSYMTEGSSSTSTDERSAMHCVSHPFDLIFMDSEMARVNGIEAVRRIRQELKYTGVIVAVTGNDGPASRDGFMEAGANEVHLKPMKLATVKSIIGTNIEHKVQEVFRDRVDEGVCSSAPTKAAAPGPAATQLN